MIKLKTLLKEDAPGFNNRKFGDSLPTLSSVMKKHQREEIQNLNEVDVSMKFEKELKSVFDKITGKEYNPKTEFNKVINSSWYKKIMKRLKEERFAFDREFGEPLKESSPGFENRQWGDKLPTLSDISDKHRKKDAK